MLDLTPLVLTVLVLLLVVVLLFVIVPVLPLIIVLVLLVVVFVVVVVVVVASLPLPLFLPLLPVVVVDDDVVDGGGGGGGEIQRGQNVFPVKNGWFKSSFIESRNLGSLLRHLSSTSIKDGGRVIIDPSRSVVGGIGILYFSDTIALYFSLFG